MLILAYVLILLLFEFLASMVLTLDLKLFTKRIPKTGRTL